MGLLLFQTSYKISSVNLNKNILKGLLKERIIRKEKEENNKEIIITTRKENNSQLQTFKKLSFVEVAYFEEKNLN